MIYIKSIIFTILFYLMSFLVLTLGIPLLFAPKKITNLVPVTWSVCTRFLLKYIAGIQIKITGRENLPVRNGYIVASKHESAMETCLFHSIVPNVSYVLKSSLMWVPLAGFYFIATGCIPINRSKGTIAMRKMFDKATKNLHDGQNIVIFPEGTRQVHNQATRYNPGVALIYEKCQVPVVPVALNTGLFWPKNSYKKFPGIVEVKILPPIQPGLNKRDFLNLLEEKIEKACHEMK